MKQIEILTYRRWSDGSQKTSGKIQDDVFDIHLGEQWLKELLGGEPHVADTYNDRGKSASKKKSKRDDFKRMLSDIETKHRGKPLLVMNLSRLTRLHPDDALDLFSLLKKSGNNVISVDDRKMYKRQTLFDTLEILIKANDNHEYSRSLAKNTLRGKMKTILEGGCGVRTVPYGMAKLVRFEDGTEKTFPRTQSYNKSKSSKSWLVPGEQYEIDVVKWLFNEIKTSNCSFGKLQRTLNRHENPLVRKGITGRGWSVPSIIHILSNLHYNGWEFIGDEAGGEHYRVGPNGDVVEVANFVQPTLHKVRTKFPAIIDDETWLGVQDKLARRKASKHKAKTGIDGEGYPLTGCVVCGNCGKNMQADFKHGVVNYVCRQKYDNETCGCSYWSVREDVLLPFTLDLLDKEVMKQLDDKPKVSLVDDGTKEKLLVEIEAMDKKISMSKVKLLNDTDAADILTDQLVEYSKKKKELQLAVESIGQGDGETKRIAFDYWRESVAPLLVGVRTGDVDTHGVSFSSGEKSITLDRLKNFTQVRPSVIREQFHGMGLQVRLWFKPTGKKAPKFEVANGRIEATIKGKKEGWNMESVVCS